MLVPVHAQPECLSAFAMKIRFSISTQCASQRKYKRTLQSKILAPSRTWISVLKVIMLQSLRVLTEQCSCVRDVIVKLDPCQVWFCSASWLLQALVHAAGRSAAEFGCLFFGSETKRVLQWTTPTFQLPWIHLMWIPSWFSKPVFYLIWAIGTAQCRLKTWVSCLISSQITCVCEVWG